MTSEMGAKRILRGSNPEPFMSALGQKQTSAHVRVMSALPPKADITERDRYVRFVPKADISGATINACAACTNSRQRVE